MKYRTYFNNRRGAISLGFILGLVGILVVGGGVAYLILNNGKVSVDQPTSAPSVNTTSSAPVPVAPALITSSTLTSTGTFSKASSTLSPLIGLTKNRKRSNPATSSVMTSIIPPDISVVPPPVVSENLPVTLPALVPTSTSVQVSVPQVPSVISIDPQTLVGVLCYFRATYTNHASGKSVVDTQLAEDRGSGVIINSQGYILTNRHVIKQAQDTTTITDANGNAIPITIDYQLDHCEVGQMPRGTHLPTADEIRALNPFVQIPVLGYIAQPVFISPTAGRSSVEVDAADFAILKITGVSTSGPTFGVTSVPASFPYAKLLPVDQYNLIDEPVVTYGFPGDVTTGQGNAFETLTMTGSVGRIVKIEVGDSFYAATPLIITARMEVSHGRSGSPLFWRGYVVGIVTYYLASDRTNSGSVASDAILKALQGTGYYGG